MTTRQSRILFIASATLVAMLLFPPFDLRLANGVVMNLGYGFLLDPPKRGQMAGSVDIGLLLVQWVGVLILAVPFWLSSTKEAAGSIQGKTPLPRWLRSAVWVGAFIVVVLLLALAKGMGKQFGKEAYGLLSSKPEASSNFFDRFDDPATEEKEAIEEAAKLGIPLSLYRQREARSRVLCRDGSFVNLDCSTEVMEGRK
jgi:hypothetical protein